MRAVKRFRDGSKGTSAPRLSPTLFVHFRECRDLDRDRRVAARVSVVPEHVNEVVCLTACRT